MPRNTHAACNSSAEICKTCLWLVSREWLAIIHSVMFQSVSRHLLTSYKPLMKSYKCFHRQIQLTFSPFFHIICCVSLPPATKLGPGNIFSSVCQDFCTQGRPAPLHAGIPPARRPPLARRPPYHSACWDIWPTNWRYASYWNAYLTWMYIPRVYIK